MAASIEYDSHTATINVILVSILAILLFWGQNGALIFNILNKCTLFCVALEGRGYYFIISELKLDAGSMIK
jgi:hypothetical protein